MAQSFVLAKDVRDNAVAQIAIINFEKLKLCSEIVRKIRHEKADKIYSIYFDQIDCKLIKEYACKFCILYIK